MEPRGIRFPFQFGAAGGVRVVEGVDKVKSNLECLVRTDQKERVIRKDVGTVGYKAVFRSFRSAGSGLIRDLVFEAVAKYERRALLDDVLLVEREDKDGTSTYIDLRFVFKETGEDALVSVRRDW